MSVSTKEAITDTTTTTTTETNTLMTSERERELICRPFTKEEIAQAFGGFPLSEEAMDLTALLVNMVPQELNRLRDFKGSTYIEAVQYLPLIIANLNENCKNNNNNNNNNNPKSRSSNLEDVD